MNQRLLDWAQLVRLPNVFTVLADVGAAFLLVAGSGQPVGRFLCVLLAGVSLYWAGMILNDVFDIERDRRERPKRPLPSGAISLQHAKHAGWGLLAAGILLASLSGWLPGDNAPSTWLPTIIAAMLAILIVAYDGPLKSMPIAPAVMGGCRVLSFLLGASPMLPKIPITPDDGSQLWIPSYVLTIAIGFGVYITGITTMARDEATGGNRMNLRAGFTTILIASVILALAPQFAQDRGPDSGDPWAIHLGHAFPLLILISVYPLLIRALRVQTNPTQAKVGQTIGTGILTLIPLASSFAFIGAGWIWGFVIFALIAPAVLLSRRLRVT